MPLRIIHGAAPGEVAEEFYYEDGGKADADLHSYIISSVDQPIDEKIMAPIRQRHHDAWLRRQGR